MKKLSVVMILALGLGLAGLASAGSWGNIMGSGMMGGGGYGYGMGSGMMGQGYGGNMMDSGYGNNGSYMRGPGYGSNGNPGYDRPNYGTYGRERALTQHEAESIVRNYIGGNPNLKAGKIRDKETYFETEVRTKDNSLVSKLAIDKNTGYVRQLY